MAEKKKVRTYHSVEERKEAIDKKIEYHKACIASLEKKKASIGKGRSGGTRTKTIKRLINDAKLNDDEIVEIMNLGDIETTRNRLNEIIKEKSKKE